MDDNWNYFQSQQNVPLNPSYGNDNSWQQPPVLVPPFPSPMDPPSQFTQPPLASTSQYNQNTDYGSYPTSNYYNPHQNYSSYNSGDRYNSYMNDPPQNAYQPDNPYGSRNYSRSHNYRDELHRNRNMEGNSQKRSEKADSGYSVYNRKTDVSSQLHFRHRSRSLSVRKRHSSSPKEKRSSISINDRSLFNNKSERDLILSKWRKNYCTTREEVCNKIKELSRIDPDKILEKEKSVWTKTTPANLYYERDKNNPKVTNAAAKLLKICDTFKESLVLRASKINALKPKYEPPPRKHRARVNKRNSEESSSTGSSEEELTDEADWRMEELTRKQQHPDRLHPEMWFNDPGEMNDGPLCRCSKKARKSGIRHGIYAGERYLQRCNKTSNNADKLYHYRITISPLTNFLIKTPTIIEHNEHEFIFEGFSMLSHFPLIKLPTCKVTRFNIEYSIHYIEEKIPENFTILELDLFYDYLFREILELVDLDLKAAGDEGGCSQFHFMPRFVREIRDNGKEILSMNEVLQYLLKSATPLICESQLEDMVNMSRYEWQSYADEIRGMVVTYPGKKPCSVRVDQLDRNNALEKAHNYKFPEIVHFGIRPPQLSYVGNSEYKKAWREYVKCRHLLANMSKPTYEDKRKLEAKEKKLQDMRTQSKMKGDVTVAVSANGFYRTGIMCDIVQHAMLIPVLVCHLRFQSSINILEETIQYKFHNRALLQLALTHPSYCENFGTNPDHARNSLTNCGIRRPEYGDQRIHHRNRRKRGINTLINIMSQFGEKQETESKITHNERLEFLGDAVVGFVTTTHLFFTFPDLEEGGLATYRAAIVQNQHLAVLARKLNLDQYMLYAHGSDLCSDLELQHAMANCFEALVGALFLDGGIEIADRVFSQTLYKEDSDMLEVWMNLPPHPLQEQEPTGDRDWIPKFDMLQKLVKFEDSIGVDFTHIRLLAQAFTDRSLGFTNLTLGSNQRLEFLGDTVFQLIASDYLYKFFPEHHEGHLSLLRSSLVSNRTQAIVCDDLGMANYAVHNKTQLGNKDKADLLEAFIAALYVDKGMTYCEVFCQVTLFPRLHDFIKNQDWNDPKSKLQQCCLTLRTMGRGEPDIPVYRVIECKGPTNTRVFTVAVYFRGERLASAMGHSIQQAEMNAAKAALEVSHELFPQLDHQKQVIAKSMKKHTQQPDRHLSRFRSRSSRSRTRSVSRRSSKLKTRKQPSCVSSNHGSRSKKHVTSTITSGAYRALRSPSRKSSRGPSENNRRNRRSRSLSSNTTDTTRDSKLKDSEQCSSVSSNHGSRSKKHVTSTITSGAYRAYRSPSKESPSENNVRNRRARSLSSNTTDTTRDCNNSNAANDSSPSVTLSNKITSTPHNLSPSLLKSFDVKLL